MNEPTCTAADMICRTVELGVTITGAAVDTEGRTRIFCQVLTPDRHCPGCNIAGQRRDHVDRVLTDVPAAGRPVLLHAAVPRFNCSTADCPQVVFRADISHVAAPRSVMTRRTQRWILQRIAIDKMSVSAVAAQLGISWKAVNTVAVESARTLVYDGGHIDGVRHLGVDERKWKHVRGQGDSGWVTVLIDLTPVVDGTGPARLLDMIAGRSKQVLKTWMAGRDQKFRDQVKVVAMDGFTGYKTATAEELPDARIVMDPFHVVRLAGEKLDRCRTRVQQDTCGHRGRAGDPPDMVRRILHTRPALLTDKQKIRLFEALTSRDEHVAVEITHQVHLQIIGAYEHSKRLEARNGG